MYVATNNKWASLHTVAVYDGGSETRKLRSQMLFARGRKVIRRVTGALEVANDSRIVLKGNVFDTVTRCSKSKNDQSLNMSVLLDTRPSLSGFKAYQPAEKCIYILPRRELEICGRGDQDGMFFTFKFNVSNIGMKHPYTLAR